MPDPTVFAAPPPKKARLVHARIEFQEIANTYPTDIAIAAGMKETLVALRDAVQGMATPERLAALSAPRLAAAREAQAKADARRKADAEATWNASPMSWERVSAELDSALEDDAIIVPELDYRTPFEWLNLDRGRKRLIGQTTGFALGWGIGAALGVKIAKPDQQVVCMVGDGALLFGQVEALWTASRYDVPVLIIVMNNRSYDNERNRIQNNSPLLSNQDTRDLWKDVTCYLGNPLVDFAGLARSFGIDGQRASTPAEFRKALKRGTAVLREGRPYLIDAMIMQLDRRGAPHRADLVPADLDRGRPHAPRVGAASAATPMKFSTFGERFTRHTGAVELMTDLGAAMAADEPPMMLGGGNPAHIPEMLAVFREQFRAVIDDDREFRRLVADYPDPAGEQTFRSALAGLLRRECGWHVGPENIALTAGSQQGFFLLFNLLAGPQPDGVDAPDPPAPDAGVHRLRRPRRHGGPVHRAAAGHRACCRTGSSSTAWTSRRSTTCATWPRSAPPGRRTRRATCSPTRR